MEARDWVKERFGSTEVKTLLNEDVYSKEQLREDKAKLEQNLRQIRNEREKHAERYEKLMKKGAGKPDQRKKQYAQKAKFEKKKYKIKGKKEKAQNIKLGTIISIEGMRDVLSIQNEQSIALEKQLDEMDAQQLQGEIMDQMAEFGLEIDDMKQVQDALDIEVLDQDLETDVSEEMEAMRDMEAGQISEEKVRLDEEDEPETDDMDIDIEDDDLSLDGEL